MSGVDDLVARITEVMNLPAESGRGLALTGKGYVLLHNIRRELADLLERIAALEGERDALRAFAQEVMEDFHLGDLDGGDRQDLAAKHGLLREVEVREPCGEGCVCTDYGCFPTDCFRMTTLLTGKPESDEAIAALDAARVGGGGDVR